MAGTIKVVFWRNRNQGLSQTWHARPGPAESFVGLLFSRKMGYSIWLRMDKTRLAISGLLQKLEAFYGKQKPGWPTDPYLFLVWWHSGYPASDAACTKGWETLTREIGTGPQQLLGAS